MLINGKKITTVISDLDGTLLQEDGTLKESLFPLIRQLKQNGIAFVAASGRQYLNMKRLFEPVLGEISFICENGSMIIKDEQTIYQKCFDSQTAFELIEDMERQDGTCILVSSERKLYTLSGHPEYEKLAEGSFALNMIPVDDLKKLTGEINKISIWWKDGIPGREEQWFHEKYDSRLQVMQGGNGWLDFNIRGVHKGTALKELSHVEGFSLKDAVCFGDSENDIEMFRECGISYAMKNAKESVRKEADFICEDVEEVLRKSLD